MTMCTPKQREPQSIMFLPWISINHHESVWITMNQYESPCITKNVGMVKTCHFFVCGLRNHLESPLYLWLYFVIRGFFCDSWWFILNHGKKMIYCGFFSFQGAHCHPIKSLEWPLDPWNKIDLNMILSVPRIMTIDIRTFNKNESEFF